MIFKPSIFAIGIAAGVALILSVYWYGYFDAAADYKKIIADGQAKFARRISAANAQTRATRERLAGELKVSEAKIDDWKTKYDAILAKDTDASCLLSDADVRGMRYGRPRNSRPKS